ncbi:MAG: hypothetical protein FWG23_02290 [Eggerthellaceae bacterium]|jgi:hypothetical protein|nr:hypothetical protein [Eggerthellaceae bacterium]
MAEHSQDGLRPGVGRGNKGWVAVRIVAAIYLLVLVYMSLADFFANPGGGSNAPYMVHLFFCLVSITGCILLILRVKIVGMLLVALGTVAAVVFIMASGISFGDVGAGDGQYATYIILLTVVPALILVGLAAVAKK